LEPAPTPGCSGGPGEPSTEATTPRERWNRRYERQTKQPFPQTPAAWLTENRTTLLAVNRGRALDIACGDGRNSAYLAQLGFEVDALDISDIAIDTLRTAAAQRGLTVNPRRVDLELDPIPRSIYDVIVMFNYLQRSLFAPLAKALAPGGILIVETVTRAHLEDLGNDFDPRYVLNRNELRGAFPALDVLRYQECIAERSGSRRAVASLVAQRRATIPVVY
jgi:tellurite methyltransferase